MDAKDFFEYIEKNNLNIRIEKMCCVDLTLNTVLENINGKYYDVWVVTGGSVSCSGRKGEPLENVVNRWALAVEDFAPKEVS